MSNRFRNVHVLKNLPIAEDFDIALSQKSFAKYSIKKCQKVSYLPNEVLEYVFAKTTHREIGTDLQDILFLEEVSSLVLDKMKEKDSHLPLWTVEDYFCFRNELRLFGKEELEFAKSTLLRCLFLSSAEILEILHNIASQVDFYPEVERTYISDENRYYIQPKEIKETDIYHVIPLLQSKMKQLIRKEAARFCTSFDDFDILCQILLEIGEEESDERRNAILTPFYEEFSYLRENPLFMDLYIQYRNQYIEMFRRCCFEIHRNETIKTSIERKHQIEEKSYKIEMFAHNQRKKRR